MKTDKGFVVTAENGRQRPVVVCEEFNRSRNCF
jgi:hypothetical protein